MTVPATSLNKKTGSALVVRNWEVGENIGFFRDKRSSNRQLHNFLPNEFVNRCTWPRRPRDNTLYDYIYGIFDTF